MRKLMIPALLAGTLLLGGCAYGTGYGYDDGYGPGGGYNDGYSYRQNSEFERAAVNACGREASRYGRVQITYAEERERGVFTVQGRIDVRDRSRDQFTCAFSSSGRILDFRFG